MTKSETEALLKYMLSMYPNIKWTEQQFNNNVIIWSNELANESRESVARAFKAAKMESPDWMPTLPKIQASLRSFSSVIKEKSIEQEFMDRHCGKTEEEWNSVSDWENSDEGRKAINSYKERILNSLK